MKKQAKLPVQNKRPLVIRTETIRSLAVSDLEGVGGGSDSNANDGCTAMPTIHKPPQ